MSFKSIDNFTESVEKESLDNAFYKQDMIYVYAELAICAILFTVLCVLRYCR